MGILKNDDRCCVARLGLLLLPQQTVVLLEIHMYKATLSRPRALGVSDDINETNHQAAVSSRLFE